MNKGSKVARPRAAHLKSRLQRISGAQGNQRGAGQRTILADTGQGVTQRVFGRLPDAFLARAPDVMRLRKRRSTIQQNFDDFVIVPVRRED